MNRNHPYRAALTLMATAAALAGCSAHERANRVDDWAQVFTFTVGEGAGAKLRLGPAQLGLYKGEDRTGLRAGTFGTSGDVHDNYDYLWLCYGREYFGGWDSTPERLQARRVTAATHYFPFVVERRVPSPRPFIDVYGESRTENGAYNNAYWTQIDLALGLGATVRLGFNPGELLDAALGHVGLDLYRDDLPDLTPAAPSGATATRRTKTLPLTPVAPKTAAPAPLAP